MWKLLKYLGYAALLVVLPVIGLLLIPLAMAVLRLIVFAVLSPFDDALDGLSRSETAIAALEASQLSAYVENAPYHCITIDDMLTAFEMPWYDNHVDNTDLRAGLMALIADTDGWHVEAVTPEVYAAQLPAEATYFLPDVTFDAWFESAEGMAFYDQESGLFVHLREGETPKPGTVRAYKLTVLHNGFVYAMKTHGGFHGDGTTFYALIVPEENRTAFEAVLHDHTDWHEGIVTHVEYAELLSCFYECPELLPSGDVAFDQWCYVDTYARAHPHEEPDRDVHPCFPAVMRDAGARFSQNWLVALYDADTGLFIYYEYDS